MWEVKSNEYRKLKETIIFEDIYHAFEISQDGNVLLFSLSYNRASITYDALTLTRLNKFELVATIRKYSPPIYLSRSSKISNDGKYIISGEGRTKFIFNNEGKRVNTIDDYWLHDFFMYSNTEFAGFEIIEEDDEKWKRLIVIDYIENTEDELMLIEDDSYTYKFNRTATAYIAYDSSTIKYGNLKDKNSKENEIITYYTSLQKYAFNGNKVAILYSINDKNFILAVFEDGIQKWKHNIKESSMKVHDMMFKSGDIDSVMILALSNTKFQVYTVEENFATDYSIKPIRNITLNNLKLTYAWDNKEIWIQDFNNNIKIYRFDASISAFENCCKIKSSTDRELKLQVLLDYQYYFRIGRVTLTDSKSELVLSKRRVEKVELPNGKVKAFYNIRVHNYNRKSIDDGIMLHFKDSLIILSLISKSIKYEIKKTAKKANVITLKDNSAIFFWEDKGDKLEMMRIPYDPLSK